CFPITPLLSPLPYTTLFRSPRFVSRVHVKVISATGGATKPGIVLQCVGGFIGRIMAGFSVANVAFGRACRKGSLTCGLEGSQSRSEEHTSELQSRVDLVCRL